LPIEQEGVKNAGDLEDMKKHLDGRLDDVNSFMKNNNKQLDARDW